MNQECRRCGNLFQQDDLVKAEVLSYFKVLKSKCVYAIDKPHECLWMEHYNCQYPQTGEPDGE